jgi:ketosteroid isomerase-like protein
MRTLCIVLAAAVLATGSAAATDKTDIMSVIHQFVDAINKGDGNLIAKPCADQTSIIDDFPPHEWHGPGACAKWFSDFQTFIKAGVITDARVGVGKPWHVDVSADRAYVVAPSTFSLRKQGKSIKEIGILTVSLKKTAADWRMTGWAWADH